MHFVFIVRYMLFLDQYEAVSFGDPVFGAYVLLPMQQCQNCLLRRAVWQERSNLLRTLTLSVREVSCWQCLNGTVWDLNFGAKMLLNMLTGQTFNCCSLSLTMYSCSVLSSSCAD